jgi:phosphoserine phosphatase
MTEAEKKLEADRMAYLRVAYIEHSDHAELAEALAQHKAERAYAEEMLRAVQASGVKVETIAEQWIPAHLRRYHKEAADAEASDQ